MVWAGCRSLEFTNVAVVFFVFFKNILERLALNSLRLCLLSYCTSQGGEKRQEHYDPSYEILS